MIALNLNDGPDGEQQMWHEVRASMRKTYKDLSCGRLSPLLLRRAPAIQEELDVLSVVSAGSQRTVVTHDGDGPPAGV